MEQIDDFIVPQVAAEIHDVEIDDGSKDILEVLENHSRSVSRSVLLKSSLMRLSCLTFVEETRDMPVLVGHGPGHTCVSKHLRRATTLEDASEFDLSDDALDSPMDCVES